ncbi:MAG: hypothetical protein HY885_08685 [Deltaproteobacteria bacterium]|nr:hypothetical protein [Deltaproteobacteria bacterium]
MLENFPLIALLGVPGKIMYKILKTILWWRNPPKQQDIEDTEEYILGWNGVLESEKYRRKMTSAMLAVRLSECKINSPAYILFEHELNRRIAYVQALPAYLSIVTGIVGIFLGWALAQWKPLEQNTSLDIIADHLKKHDQTYTSNYTDDRPTETMQPRPVGKKLIIEPNAKINSGNKDNNPKKQEKNSETN